MSKTKMRCITCGKWFQSANAKEVTCPDCMQKARREKMAAKAAPPAPNKTAGQTTQGANAQARPTVSPPPKTKPSTGGTGHWLDTLSDIKVGEPDQPPRPKMPSSPAPKEQRSGPERGGYRGPGDHRDERDTSGYREGGNRGPGGYKDSGHKEGGYHSPAAYRSGEISVSIGQRPRQPMEPGASRGQQPGSPDEARPEKRAPGGRPAKPKAAKPAPPPKPKREKIPPPPPFKATAEQVVQVETRYKELATPVEFDGIRTQIAKELSIPKKAVKEIIKDLREREDIPSWWDIQTYKGDSEELEKIRAAYEVHLPLPPIGVHKQIAEALSIQPGPVYQAIKLIRQEMGLPQYNDPALHGLELIPRKQKQKRDEPQAEAELSPAATDVSPGSNNATAELQGEEKLESHLEAEPSPTTASVSLSEEDSARTTETTEVATAASDSDGTAKAQ
jgi:hypothetical protein